MREILFRAKTIPDCKDVITGKIIKTPKWIHGYIDLGYMHDCETPLISDEKGNRVYKCQYETIGQFTGLTDKNGKKIFEGDIVSFKRVNALWLTTSRVGDVRYYDTLPIFYIMATTGDAWDWVDCEDIEVIGNIHDNPELLKEGAPNA